MKLQSLDMEVVSIEGYFLSFPERLYDPKPLARKPVTFLMVSHRQARALHLGQVPSADQIDREADIADGIDAERHLRKHCGRKHKRLHRAHDFDTLGGL